MIFLTVGTQLPFNRLVRTVDEWVGVHPEVDVFAQIGPGPYTHTPANFTYTDFVTPEKARELMSQAGIIVAHAGIGTIISAMQLHKPILVLPRQASLGEHRNDHQLATAKHLSERTGVHVAWNESELMGLLKNRHTLMPANPLEGVSDSPLVEKLASIVHSF